MVGNVPHLEIKGQVNQSLPEDGAHMVALNAVISEVSRSAPWRSLAAVRRSHHHHQHHYS